MGPAVRHYDREREPDAPNPARTLLIHGEWDEVVKPQQALDWAAGQDIPVILIPQASHFFHGKLIPLRDTIQRFAPAVLQQADAR